MTKNNNNGQDVAPINKSIAEMDDIEFIAYADYLSSPYYRAYIEAKTKTQGQIRDLVIASSVQADAAAKTEKVSSVKESKLYTKKRGVALVVIAIFMFVVIAATALGVVSIGGIDNFVAAYTVPGTAEGEDINISIADPMLGLIKDLTKVEFDSNYFATFLAVKTANADIITKIALYAVPAAALIIIVLAVIGFVKALAAIFAKKTLSGKIKKSGFGLISIIMFVSALIMLVGGVFVANIEIASALEFLTQKSAVMNVGFGLYALVAIPIITFICSCVSYKK